MKQQLLYSVNEEYSGGMASNIAKWWKNKFNGYRQFTGKRNIFFFFFFISATKKNDIHASCPPSANTTQPNSTTLRTRAKILFIEK